MQIKRRGVELRLVIDGDRGRVPKADPALLKAVARAHRWFDDLVSGRAKSMLAIAAREAVQKHYVRQLVRLAFLCRRWSRRLRTAIGHPTFRRKP
jgi:site-specific DNA recombinase